MSDETETAVKEEPKEDNALMDALFKATESEEPSTELPERLEARTLSEIMRQAEAGEIETPAPVAEEAPKEAPVAVSQREATPEPAPVPQQPIPQQQVVEQVPQQPLPPNPEEGLLPEQKERLRLARVAEQMYNENPQDAPPEYQGLYAKYLNYFQKESEYVKDKTDFEELDWDDGYKAIKEKLDPGLSEADVKRLEREELKREVKSELNANRAEIARLKQDIHVQKAEPQVRAKMADYVQKNYQNAVPEDMRKIISEDKGKFKESHPFEYDIVDRTLRRANEYVMQFEAVNNGVQRYDPAIHGSLSRRIESLGQAYKKVAKPRKGQVFVTRSEYAKLDNQQKAAHYTWSADEVKQAFSSAAKTTISKKLSDLNSKLENYKGGPKKRQPVAKQDIQPTPKTATPRTPTPSTASSSGEVQESALTAMLLS